MNEIETMLLYKHIESNLEKQFDEKCPVLPPEKAILTNKDDIVDEFKKWYDFWESKCPRQTVLSNNVLVNMKQYICELKLVGIFKELERIDLLEYYKEKFKIK